jgi:hypothetical protein
VRAIKIHDTLWRILINHDDEVPRLVSVKERVPKRRACVRALYKGELVPAVYWGGNAWNRAKDNKIINVSYWEYVRDEIP